MLIIILILIYYVSLSAFSILYARVLCNFSLLNISLSNPLYYYFALIELRILKLQIKRANEEVEQADNYGSFSTLLEISERKDRISQY